MKMPEILAPAGSPEALTAALRCGADAVYIGGKRFSARNSEASGFSDEQIRDASELCHKYGAKLHLAVNTVITDDEAKAFCGFIRYAASVGVDAFIVQDHGCAELIRQCVPDAVLHASTQMSVHTAAGAELLSELGFARVVPARELDKKTIAEICGKNIETEIFVHGALCMSVSGQCYMSAMMGSRSANRGCCGQACRLPFSAVGSKNETALSLKDLSLLENARELANIGVDSFKTEGRMKRPEYVAAAVSELKASLNGKAPDIQMLRGIFSRSGFTNGYYSGLRTDMFGRREKDDVISAKALIPKLHELYRSERKKFPVSFHASIKTDTPVEIKAVCGDISASVTGDIPETALNRPTDLESVKKQLSRLGDTVFYPDTITAEIDDGLIVPAGRLNELRRALMNRLTELMIKKNTPVYTIRNEQPQMPEHREKSAHKRLPLRTFCRRREQLSAAAEMSEYIIIPIELLDEETIKTIGCGRIIASPPRYISDEKTLTKRLAELLDKGVNRLFCHTLDTIAIGRKLGYILHGSYTLNVCNSFSAERMKRLGLEDCIFSFETKLTHLEKLCTSMNTGIISYGRLPLMLTRNCPIKNEIGCEKCTGAITDRTGRSFPIACSKEYFEILNTDKLYMNDRTDELCSADFAVMLLSEENEEQTRLALSGRKPEGNITRGLYYRGI